MDQGDLERQAARDAVFARADGMAIANSHSLEERLAQLAKDAEALRERGDDGSQAQLVNAIQIGLAEVAYALHQLTLVVANRP
jgi:hypothetical protein